MPREIGEPDVTVSVTPEGVRLTLSALFRGDGTDWGNEVAGAWLLGVWERTLAMAKLNHDYGINLPSPAPEVREVHVSDVLLPEVKVIERAPAAPTEAERLNQLIERAEQNGSLYHDNLRKNREWRQDIIAQIRKSPKGGLTFKQIREAYPNISHTVLSQRLKDFRGPTRVIFKRFEWGRNMGMWVVDEAQDGSDSEGHLKPINDLAAVIPHTRGKVVLMLGGVCQQQRQKEIEATLCLQELRWPGYEQSDPIVWRLQDIGKPDVDLVLVNRFNKRYSRQYQHEARDCGKPVVTLSGGLGLTQIVHQLRSQWVDRLGLAEPERVAA